jgi:hypothetical protein
MKTGKIRFVINDPLSRRAKYRGILHFEYINQDPDRVQPVNPEKISQKFEWEGSKSDYFGLFIATLILMCGAYMLFKRSA